MAIAADTSTLTTAEVDAILRATASPAHIHKDPKKRVAYVGNVATPTMNMFMARGKVNGIPTRGAYRAYISTPRNGSLQSISGRDIKTFQSKETLEDVDYRFGRVHMGDEWVHDQIQYATGLSVSKDLSVRGEIDITSPGWWKGTGHPDAVMNQLVNLAEVKHNAFRHDMKQQVNKKFWRANTSDNKAWAGLDALLSASSATTGTVGNRDRASSPYLRHQLYSSVAADDLELAVTQIMRDAARYVHDDTKLDFSACGENVFDILMQKLYTGSSSISKMFDRNYAEDKAQEMASMFKIGLPSNAIYVRGIGIVTVEPVFRELQLEDAASPNWNNRWYFFNTSHIDFKWSSAYDPDKVTVHPCEGTQDVTRMSRECGAALVASRLDTHGVITISGS